jgi:hypothetical protein
LALSSLDDGSHVPSRTEVDDSLGSSARLWARLVAGVAKVHAPIEQAWTFSGPKYGWSLRLKHGDRVLLYMTPQRGCFLLGVVLAEKAAQMAHDDGLPGPLLTTIDAAPRYAEGRGIRTQLATSDDLALARALADLKMTSVGRGARSASARIQPPTQESR